MANTSGRQNGSMGKRLAVIGLLILVALIAAVLWLNRAPIAGYSGVATSYAARVACSCRFVAGRDLDDCSKDKLGGMEMVSLSEDAEAQSVTATIPFVESVTATKREGYGCVLEKWEG
ncbi:hypothetical protein INR77_01940 [Erythrobacter sp. SCSIO 43205]|uniref:hypothetical protein n=1 Tax=Erythrobacter sp. SCSIO 43205 TaxID=2779361 RepID=UPI001CAA0E83|nr:hypothetical protein [Erythrobacter sp. SCSIO 43205]UAB78521.1 hypothetical protein INR77_01940 [Erythrobacter sp. SCSIO 43205]